MLPNNGVVILWVRHVLVYLTLRRCLTRADIPSGPQNCNRTCCNGRQGRSEGFHGPRRSRHSRGDEHQDFETTSVAIAVTVAVLCMTVRTASTTAVTALAKALLLQSSSFDGWIFSGRLVQKNFVWCDSFSVYFGSGEILSQTCCCYRY